VIGNLGRSQKEVVVSLSEKMPPKESKKKGKKTENTPSRALTNVSDDEETTCSCLECGKDVIEEGVKCEMCDNWYHCKCQGVSKALYAALQEAVSDEEDTCGLHWYCRRCNKACVKLHRSITLISKEQGLLDKRVVKVENVIEEMEKGNLPDNVMKTIERKIDERVKSVTDNLSQSVRKEVSEKVSNVNASVNKSIEQGHWQVAQQVHEKEKRKLNLMFFKVPECASEDTEERIQYDTGKVKDIVTQDLSLTWKDDVQTFTRIGKKNSDAIRPLRVTMKCMDDKKRILDRLRDLRANKDDIIKSIFIQADMTKEEREERKKLRAELLRRKDAGEENLVIRGGRVQKGNFRS